MTAMSLTVPVAAVPRSRGEWCRYVEAQIEAREFGEESELLRVLAGRSRDDGSADIGVELLMRKLRKSRATVLRHLKALRDHGVLRTERRGRGRVSRHRLLAEPVERQLSLFEDVGRGPVTAASAEPVQVSATVVSSPAVADTGRPAPAPAADDALSPSWGLTSAVMRSRERDPAVEGQRTTTASVCEIAPAREPLATVTSPSLERVLGVLGEAGALLNVEDGPIDKALRQFPEAPDAPFDHLRAAGFVVTQALEPDCRCRAAGVLLYRELERQRNTAARATTDRGCAPGRRRPAAPAPTVTRSPAGRRWVVTDNKYDRAAGLSALAS